MQAFGSSHLLALYSLTNSNKKGSTNSKRKRFPLLWQTPFFAFVKSNSKALLSFAGLKIALEEK
jgi:hypothetical protein